LEDEPLGPGLHRQRAADPATHAAALATQLDGVVCVTRAHTVEELARRRAQRTPGPEAVASLDALAARLARAGRISERTRVRAEAEVAQRLATASAGVAVHPTTIRDRAAAVEAARRTLLDAEAEIAAEAAASASLEREPAEAVGPDPAVDGAAADPQSGLLMRTRRNRALGVMLAAAGVGLLLLGLRATALWVALLPLLAASLWAMRYLTPSRGSNRSDRSDRSDRAEASSLLAEVGASTDELFGARHAAQADERAGLPSLPAVRRDRPLEELRVAERAWHELAGDDVDVEAVEDVIRRYDPQHEDARLLAADVVAVRATEALIQNLEGQWSAAWADLGADAPRPDDAADAIEALRTGAARAVVLVGEAVGEADELVRALPAAPVVVVEPERPDDQPQIS
jgi:hypothetical protein